MNNIEELINEAYDFGIIQNRYEITEAAKFFRDLNVNNFIEIGTDQGGSFLIWSKLSNPDGYKITIDWPHGPWSHEYYDIEKRNQKIKSLGKNVFIFEGNSHTEKMYNQVKNTLNGEKVDFLFIDGDHSYEGVKLDFYMYKEFVKPGGYVGFHDIKNTEKHKNLNCYVGDFWDELEYPKVWFLSENEWGGIGLIQIN